jgi:hypothetical protein
MENREFQVEVICRQRSLYTIAAADAETAEKMAAERWQRGDQSDLHGVDWCELEDVEALALTDVTSGEADDELLLRFIRQRELLLIRLGNNLLDPSINDAISAAQAAADLGWVRAGSDSSLDVIRAAQALERLCENRLLICFERDRVRAGERGAIRLYCTPEYLDRLSAATLNGSVAPPLP